MNRLITRCILPVTTLMMSLTGCIHQWPEELPMRDATLLVHHESPEWSYFDFLTNYRSRSDSGRSLAARYIFRVYPAGESSICYSTTTLYSDDLSREDFTASISVPVGDYDIRVYSDYVDRDTHEALYYDADDFSSITYKYPYVGATREKDSFRGVCTVSVLSSTNETEHVEGVINLQRPLTAYAFVSTDLAEFVRSEIARRNAPSINETTDAGVPSVPMVDFEGYKVTVSYPAFLPCVYNNFTDKPVDSAVGVKFDAEIHTLNENEALVGFDYFFINGEESGVRAALDIYDPDGDLIASVPGVDIPVKRNRCTIVRGEFLTSKASGSTGIAPEFFGDYNIPLN